MEFFVPFGPQCFERQIALGLHNAYWGVVSVPSLVIVKQFWMAFSVNTLGAYINAIVFRQRNATLSVCGFWQIWSPPNKWIWPPPSPPLPSLPPLLPYSWLSYPINYALLYLMHIARVARACTRLLSVKCSSIKGAWAGMHIFFTFLSETFLNEICCMNVMTP